MTRQLVGLGALALGFAAFGYAQQQKVGTISVQSALVATKEGQKAAAELEAKAGPKRKEIEAKQNEINGLKDQLQKGANTLSDAAKNDLYRTIDQKTKNLNREMQDAEDEMQQESQKVLSQLSQKLLAEIKKYAADHGYTLVIDVSNPQTPVLVASDAFDITRDIVALYDRDNGGGASAPASSKPPINTSAPASTPAAAARPGTAAPVRKP